MYVNLNPCKFSFGSMSGTNIDIKYVNVNHCKLSYSSMSGKNIGIKYVNAILVRTVMVP